MGKSWDHKITPLSDKEKTRLQVCEFNRTCENFPAFRVEYKFAPARHGTGGNLALKDGPTELRKFLYCLPHASILAKKEGICLTCGARFPKSSDSDVCGGCFSKRVDQSAAQRAAAAVQTAVSAAPILPPAQGPLDPPKPRKSRKGARRG